MPLTEFQKDVVATIAGNRSVESHIAVGLVLNASADSARYSHDIDIFHEVAEEVERASELDRKCLEMAGFTVAPTRPWEKPETFRKAVISRGTESVEIDWAADSAFRFFPVEEDPVLGWKLHLFDMATNKALALSARSETRDYVDIVELGGIYPLAAICWAACGKDEGFSPLFLLKMMLRFAKIDPAKLDKIKAKEIDQIALKKAWLGMADEADAAIERVADSHPDLPIGCAFLDADGVPRWFEDSPDLIPHFGSIRGCLPEIRID